jgi:hypothetical protein
MSSGGRGSQNCPLDLMPRKAKNQTLPCELPQAVETNRKDRKGKGDGFWGSGPHHCSLSKPQFHHLKTENKITRYGNAKRKRYMRSQGKGVFLFINHVCSEYLFMN